MTTATDRTETSEDFESTRTFSAPPEEVLAALRSDRGDHAWWAPRQARHRWGAPSMWPVQQHKQVIVLHVEDDRGGPGRMDGEGVAAHARVGRHDDRLRG